MSTKAIIISGAIFVAVVVGLSFLLTSGQKPIPEASTYSVADSDKPIAQAAEVSADLGEMKVSDVKQADFELKNTGTKPLQILNINSSCNCTFGKVIYGAAESKEFGMHAQSGYVTDIAPGSFATVRVIYKPAIMPVSGLVERTVTITTNDPERKNLTFTVRANVK